jgi:hypothetical protein
MFSREFLTDCGTKHTIVSACIETTGQFLELIVTFAPFLKPKPLIVRLPPPKDP